MPFGDLLGYLRKSRGLNDTYFKDPDVKPQTSLTAEQLMRFAWQVADGMLYLSSRKVWLLCFIFNFSIHLVNCLTASIKLFEFPSLNGIVLSVFLSTSN